MRGQGSTQRTPPGSFSPKAAASLATATPKSKEQVAAWARGISKAALARAGRGVRLGRAGGCRAGGAPRRHQRSTSAASRYKQTSKDDTSLPGRRGGGFSVSFDQAQTGRVSDAQKSEGCAIGSGGRDVVSRPTWPYTAFPWEGVFPGGCGDAMHCRSPPWSVQHPEAEGGGGKGEKNKSLFVSKERGTARQGSARGKEERCPASSPPSPAFFSDFFSCQTAATFCGKWQVLAAKWGGGRRRTSKRAVRRGRGAPSVMRPPGVVVFLSPGGTRTTGRRLGVALRQRAVGEGER